MMQSTIELPEEVRTETTEVVPIIQTEEVIPTEEIVPTEGPTEKLDCKSQKNSAVVSSAIHTFFFQ